MDAPARACGIDFGTSNSAVAFVDGHGRVQLAPLPAPDGGAASTWRSSARIGAIEPLDVWIGS